MRLLRADLEWHDRCLRCLPDRRHWPRSARLRGGMRSSIRSRRCSGRRHARRRACPAAGRPCHRRRSPTAAAAALAYPAIRSAPRPAGPAPPRIRARWPHPVAATAAAAGGAAAIDPAQRRAQRPVRALHVRRRPARRYVAAAGRRGRSPSRRRRRSTIKGACSPASTRSPAASSTSMSRSARPCSSARCR